MKSLLSSILLCSLLFTVISSCKQKENTKTRPNILLICVDDMNGYAVKDRYPMFQTPYIDKLRSESINFTNAACNVPVCNPSRASFFSGILPHNTGAYLNGSDGWNRSPILKEIQSFPAYFKHQGYITWGRGKILHNPLTPEREKAMWDNHNRGGNGFGPFPDKEHQYGNKFKGIQAWEGEDSDFPDNINGDLAVEFLAQKHDKPFLMYYGLWRPHTPYTAPKRFFEPYNEKEFTRPKGYKDGDLDDVPYLGTMLVDSLKQFKNKKLNYAYDELWQKFLYGYAANTSFADWNVGRVIEALDNSPYADNTIVIFWSDNGYHCGEKLRWQKATLWDQSDYVPFMVRTPEKKQAESSATISLVDIYPTLIELCGLEKPNHSLDGNSIVPLLENPNKEWDYPSLTVYGKDYTSVRSERYRYIRYPDGTEELYDHSTDPYEFENIAPKKGSRIIMDELSEELPKQWAPSTGGRLEVPRKFEDVMRTENKWHKVKKHSS
ncbi:sulfatase [Sediminitomix flava]|nr:sulfatase [Sediminitomix flava]